MNEDEYRKGSEVASKNEPEFRNFFNTTVL